VRQKRGDQHALQRDLSVDAFSECAQLPSAKILFGAEVVPFRNPSLVRS
jgi:hypothetical protein